MQPDSVLTGLQRLFADAVGRLSGQSSETVDALVRPVGDARFGDYQCNAAMGLARTLGAKPRDIAARIVAAVEPALADTAEPLEIAGPGFINIKLRSEFLAGRLEAVPAPPADERTVDRVGIPAVSAPRRIVVEYSQPNIAKQMHVGHLRSTIIGDVFARVLAFVGHDVIRQNHIGDWGTQFGMLIRWYRERPLPTPATHADVLEAIEQDYKAANERFRSDEEFAGEARRAVAQLQAGDRGARQVWEQIRDVSLSAVQDIYDRLGVLLRPTDVRGESFYNAQLPLVLRELEMVLPVAPADAPVRGEVRRDEGALVVYLRDAAGQPLFKNADGGALGMIVQKSDGAYLYATTDLAAIRFRLKELPFPSGAGAQRLIYVTDARQKLHFEMFIAAARAAGWVGSAQVDHVTFGSVLGEDRKPLKTRAGGTIKLRELLDEAENRAYELLRQRDAAPAGRTDDEGDLAPPADEEKRAIARRVGIAAVKYADLRNDRNTDYVFSWDKMLALTGNTAPYMMYAYARIRSIYRKTAQRSAGADVYASQVHLELREAAERALALRLARLRETVEDVAADLEPHVLCTYLYDLAGDFMRFYESCPVLQAPDEATRLGRLRLCDLTARTLKLGLGLLGIEVIERM